MLHLVITLRRTIMKLRVNAYGSFGIGRKMIIWFVVTVEVFRVIENISKLSVEGQPHTCIVNLFLDIGAIVGVSTMLCQDVFFTRFGMETSVKS